MDVLVMLEDRPEHSTVLAHVNSVPVPAQFRAPLRGRGHALRKMPRLSRWPSPWRLRSKAHREPQERLDTDPTTWPCGRSAARWETPRGEMSRRDISSRADLAIPFAVLQDTASSCSRNAAQPFADWSPGW